MKILDKLFELKDDKYKSFSARLIPNISKESIIGVRVPLLRKIAKELVKKNEYSLFIKNLPHNYHDENLLHALILSELKDYNQVINLVEEFLPYIDNWAACDILPIKISPNNKEILLITIKKWINSKHVYTSRFGILMLMSYYLDDNFKEDYLKMVVKVKTDEYYLKMMIAWFFQTSLVKQWDYTILYIENNLLDKWIHNKVIQKAVESYRISNEKKQYLRKLKR